VAVIAPLAAALLIVSEVRAVPREDVMAHASEFSTHVWTMTAANTVADCADDYESDYSPGTWVGLPYDWGGYMDIEEFDREIADGYGAGSHSWHGILECTAGLDCSGFVSMTLEAAHNTTSTFPDVSTPIDWSELERGDMIDDPGSHMVLFAHFAEDGSPVFWESSSSYGAHVNNSGGWGYVDGYAPLRFDDIEDGASTGTAASPREITAFPYTDYGWTAGAASDVIDSYACAPDTDEGGPEVLYRFEVEGPGTVTAVVSDADDVDIDVHILSGPSGEDCLDRDDTQAEARVDAGEVWISADTYVGRREYAGPYVLVVDFVPDDPGDGDPADGDNGDGADTGALPLGTDARPGALSPFPTGCDSAAATVGLAPSGLAALLSAVRLRRHRVRAKV
jgi:hypothetical protein